MLYILCKKLNTDLAKKKKKSSFTATPSHPKSLALPHCPIQEGSVHKGYLVKRHILFQTLL